MPTTTLHRRDLYIPHRPSVIGDGAERRIRAVANTADLDRYGTVVEPAGMRPVRGSVPLLFGHDHTQPVGRIEFVDRNEERIEFEAAITDDETWQAVRDGILTGVSIGFIAHHWTEEDGTIFIDDWELVEISLVACPANEQALIMELRSAMEQSVFGNRAQRTPDPQPEPQRPASTRTVTRAQTVTVYPNTEPRTDGYNRGGREPSQQVFREVPAHRPEWGTPLPNPMLALRRPMHVSVGTVIATRLAGAELHGLEGEVCRELQARSYGPAHGDIRIPAAVFQKRALSTDLGSAAALSPEAWLQQMLDDVAAARRWGTLSPRLGFTVVSTMRETIHIPKRLTVLDAEWQAKDADAAEFDTTFGEDELGPRYIGTTTTLRRSAIRYADPAADTIITADIRRALDDRVDQAVLFGTGVGNLPQGLLTQQPAGLVINKAGTPIETPDLFALKNLMMTTWKLDDSANGLRWCGNPALIDRLRVTSKKVVPGGAVNEWTAGVVSFDSGEGLLLSIPLIQSGRLGANAAPNAGTYDLHLIAPEMGVIAYFGGAAVDLLIDPYTLSTSGAVRITAFLDVNTVARDPNIDSVIRNASIVDPVVPRAPEPAPRSKNG